MYLPEIYDKFRQQYADITEKYQQLGLACRAAGPLDQKVQDLVKLGIAIGANSQGAVRSHTRKALAAGATPEEIIQSVLLALTTTGFPNMIAALGWVREVLEKEQAE
ncbi:MAG: carboxymuconolactone decarboxylase family protein [Syntrophobacteraceae bacterium]|jgi:AhpD family alkylhydroperoxidase|nr:carboxymuconolactone decarboxylase family protein [Syntrophobacteraceae bacterium]